MLLIAYPLPLKDIFDEKYAYCTACYQQPLPESSKFCMRCGSSVLGYQIPCKNDFRISDLVSHYWIARKEDGMKRCRIELKGNAAYLIFEPHDNRMASILETSNKALEVISCIAQKDDITVDQLCIFSPDHKFDEIVMGTPS